MIRFTEGLILGAASSGIAWAVGASTYWTAAIGVTVAALIWFAEFLLDDLL